METTDLEFYLERCQLLEINDSEVVLKAVSRWVAEGLRRCSAQAALWVQGKYRRDVVVVRWPDDEGSPYTIYSWLAGSMGVRNSIDSSLSKDCSSQLKPSLVEVIGQSSELIILELGLDFNGIYYNEHPIFFYDFEDGDIVFANLAAVRAQNKKLKKLLGSSGASLNFPDEFEKRIERVWNGEVLSNYENEAMRWFLNPESNRYHRKRMKFVSNAGRISFGDTECWYSHTIYAEDTGRFVD